MAVGVWVKERCLNGHKSEAIKGVRAEGKSFWRGVGVFCLQWRRKFKGNIKIKEKNPLMLLLL